MQTADLNQIETMEVWEGMRATFPTSSNTGTAATATVYMTFEPGAELPEHRDSAEELVVVLEGAVEASVDGETGILGEGQLAVIPAMAPHGFRNVGDVPARVLGFFGGSTNVATFTDEHGPDAWRVFVVGGPAPLTAPLPEPALV
jgi:quercetin dioxygenase-like cupin family protein